MCIYRKVYPSHEEPEEKILCANSPFEELCLLRFYMMCGGDENDLSTFSSYDLKRVLNII